MASLRVFLVFLILCGTSAADTLLWSDNFDDGNATGWTLSNAVVSTEQAHTGSYSVKATHTGTVIVAVNPGVMNASITEYKVKYQLMYASSWPTSGGGFDAGLKFFRLVGPGQEIQVELYLDGGGGSATEPLNGFASIYGNTDDGTCTRGPSGYGLDMPFLRGTWHAMEIWVKLNAQGSSDGYIQVYDNGTRVINQQSVVLRCSGTSYYDTFRLPNNIGDTDSDAISYTDSVEIWQVDAEPTPTPTPTPTPSPTPTPTPTPTPPPEESPGVAKFRIGVGFVANGFRWLFE